MVASTYIHELAHAATLERHDPEMLDAGQLDWIYVLGGVVRNEWEEERGDCN